MGLDDQTDSLPPGSGNERPATVDRATVDRATVDHAAAADQGDPSHGDDRLVDAVKRYMQLLDEGRAAALEEYLTEYADIADELRPALEGLALVHRAGPAKSSAMVVPDAEFMALPIGDFQIVGELGRGGMGVVYEAIQLSLGRKVALKVLPFASGLDEVRLKRFHNEAHAAAALHHTNIVPVYAVGSDRGVHYYAMQLIDGQTLGDLIRTCANERANAAGSNTDTNTGKRAHRPASATHRVGSSLLNATASSSNVDRVRFFRSMVRMIVQAAQALDHAHSYGIVHRDIKPGNLLLDSAGKLWVTDFGLAQVQDAASPITRTGDPLGTLRYMSPEQAAGNRTALDHRTDIYSLGITLYELLTLQPAIRGEGYREILNEVVEKEPLAPKLIEPALPVELDTIVRKAISKTPSERYATAAAMAEDLQSWLDDKPIKAKPPTVIERLAKWRRRNSGLVAVAGILLLLSTLALSATTLMVWREQAATARALERETEQRRLAEQNFMQARSAVDSFSNLAESELAYRADLQDLRRSFLETSLGFYRDFLENQSDDPSVQRDLAATSARVENMVEELRLLDNIAPLMELADRALRAELSIDDQQAELIDEALDIFQSQRQAIANQNPGGLSSDNAELTAMLHEFDAFISSQLSAGQLERLRQIARQKRLPFTFMTSEVVTALGLTREQRIDINRIIEEMRPGRGFGPSRENNARRGRDNERRGPPRQGSGFGFGGGGRGNGGGGPGNGRSPNGLGRGDGPPSGGFGNDNRPPRPQFGGGPWREPWREPTTRDTVERVLERLTPEQLEQWNDLVGEPFNR